MKSIYSFILRLEQKAKRADQGEEITDNEKNFLDKYQVGELDITGKRIDHIYHYTDDYIICRTSELVQWLLNPIPEDKYKESKERINKILPNLTRIEAQNPEEIDKVETINRLTAKGIKLALEGNEKNSKEILEDAEKRLKTFRTTYARVRYLIGSFYSASTIIFLIAFIISAHTVFHSFFIDIIDVFDISRAFLVVIASGALGGFLSVAYGIKQVNINPDFDVTVTATSRIFIAVISSVIIYIAIESNLFSELSEFLLDDQSSKLYLWMVGIISAAAGFVEYFAPNILKKVANTQEPPAAPPAA